MRLDLDRFDAVLLDLDGTVYNEEHGLPGAVDLIRKLQQTGKPYACLTNSTTSPQQLSARLSRMGVAVDPFHIYTAAAATCDYVLEKYGAGGKPRVFNLTTDGVYDMLDGRVHWVQRGDEPCDAVICGVPLNVYATEERQRIALVLLRNQGAALVGICADRVYPSPRGLEFGVGATVAMFAYAANVTPIFCGKPEKIFFIELCRRLGVQPERCVLIGDNLESDVAGGKSVGMTVILTLSGIARREELDNALIRPDAVIENLTDLL